MTALIALSACTEQGEEASEADASPLLAAMDGPTGTVAIEEVTVVGDDCPAGSFRPELSTGGEVVAVHFDRLAARLRASDEENSAKYRDRARCSIVIRLKGEEGVSYAVPVLRHQSRRAVHAGSFGEQGFSVGWLGSSAALERYQDFGLGPRPGDIELWRLGWSACSGTRELRIDADMSLSKAMGEPWLEPEELVAVDRLSIPQILVRRCGPAPPPPAPSAASALPIRSVRTVTQGYPCPVRREPTISEDRSSATLDLSEMRMRLDRLSKSSSQQWSCSFEVELDAPEGQSVVLESMSITGHVSLPGGFQASVSRLVEGQGMSKTSGFTGPVTRDIALEDRFRLDSPFVGEAAGKTSCGDRRMTVTIAVDLWRESKREEGMADLTLATAGPLKFIARPCAVP